MTWKPCVKTNEIIGLSGGRFVASAATSHDILMLHSQDE
jgi:hypothetical protein